MNTNGPDKENLAAHAWQRCHQILQLRWRWELVSVERWHLPLNRPGFCRLATKEILLDKNLSVGRTIIAVASEAKAGGPL